MSDIENPFVLAARITVKVGKSWRVFGNCWRGITFFSIFKNALDLAPYLLEYIKFRLWIFYER